jgi:hypothetical protein
MFTKTEKVDGDVYEDKVDGDVYKGIITPYRIQKNILHTKNVNQLEMHK